MVEKIFLHVILIPIMIATDPFQEMLFGWISEVLAHLVPQGAIMTFLARFLLEVVSRLTEGILEMAYRLAKRFISSRFRTLRDGESRISPWFAKIVWRSLVPIDLVVGSWVLWLSMLRPDSLACEFGFS